MLLCARIGSCLPEEDFVQRIGFSSNCPDIQKSIMAAAHADSAEGLEAPLLTPNGESGR